MLDIRLGLWNAKQNKCIFITIRMYVDMIFFKPKFEANSQSTDTGKGVRVNSRPTKHKD